MSQGDDFAFLTPIDKNADAGVRLVPSPLTKEGAKELSMLLYKSNMKYGQDRMKKCKNHYIWQGEDACHCDDAGAIDWTDCSRCSTFEANQIIIVTG